MKHVTSAVDKSILPEIEGKWTTYSWSPAGGVPVCFWFDLEREAVHDIKSTLASCVNGTRVILVNPLGIIVEDRTN